jgi:hypothetical protein
MRRLLLLRTDDQPTRKFGTWRPPSNKKTVTLRCTWPTPIIDTVSSGHRQGPGGRGPRWAWPGNQEKKEKRQPKWKSGVPESQASGTVEQQPAGVGIISFFSFFFSFDADKGRKWNKNGGGGLRWAESDESMTAVQRGKKKRRQVVNRQRQFGVTCVSAEADERGGVQNRTTSWFEFSVGGSKQVPHASVNGKWWPRLRVICIALVAAGAHWSVSGWQLAPLTAPHGQMVSSSWTTACSHCSSGSWRPPPVPNHRFHLIYFAPLFSLSN